MKQYRRFLACLAIAAILVAPAAAAFDAGAMGPGISLTGPAGLVFGVLPGLAADGGGGGRSTAYRNGQEALDDEDWKEAAAIFRKLANEKGSEADAALYWLAYALDKDDRRADALAAVRELRAAYPKSSWLDDAQALEVEMRGPRAPLPTGSDEETEELKLIAVSNLMHVEAARALPVLRKILQGNSSRELKKKALFVLGQSGSPEARQLLVEVAHGRAYPGLQEEAIRMLGIAGGQGSVAALGEIYRQAADPDVKSAVLGAYLVAGAQDAVLAVATGEKNVDLREEAIGKLGAMGARRQLRDLYARETSRELKEKALHGLGVAGDSAGLAEIARTERDVELREAAIHSMGIAGGGGPALKQIYLAHGDRQTREAVIHALFIQNNAKMMIELFRAEQDKELRREIVRKLSLMSSPEATDLLMKMLDQ